MVNLNITGVECRYGSTKIISGVNLEVKLGDFVGILGPNGSGKTTLLKSLSRVLKPHVGAILIDKDDIYNLKPVDVAKKMAVVPQDSSVGFNFSVMDVVLMGRNPHMGRFQMETPKDVEIAKKALKQVNAWHLVNRQINELSGGERQRIIIARALAQEPEILLLDEPISHLDIVNQLELMDLVKGLCDKKQLAVLAVIHDLNMAARYCTSILMLKNGEVFSFGDVDQVLTSKNIRSVFDVDAIVRKNAATNSLYVIPLSPKKCAAEKKSTVHVICGAGTGTMLLKTLIDEGFNVTAGVLNMLDTDYEACELLNIPVVTEAPFSFITERLYEENLEMIKAAGMVVVTSVPFGSGNLRNLEAAKAAIRYGIPTYVVEEVSIERRDFTGGRATQMMADLCAAGAIFVKNPADLPSFLNYPKIASVDLPKTMKMSRHMKISDDPI